MPCTVLDDAVICGPGKVVELHRESIGVRWCFRHRGRAEFIYIITADAGPSYYDPSPSIRCAECNAPDGDCFPGRYREWED